MRGQFLEQPLPPPCLHGELALDPDHEVYAEVLAQPGQQLLAPKAAIGCRTDGDLPMRKCRLSQRYFSATFNVAGKRQVAL